MDWFIVKKPPGCDTDGEKAQSGKYDGKKFWQCLRFINPLDLVDDGCTALLADIYA